MLIHVNKMGHWHFYITLTNWQPKRSNPNFIYLKSYLYLTHDRWRYICLVPHFHWKEWCNIFHELFICCDLFCCGYVNCLKLIYIILIYIFKSKLFISVWNTITVFTLICIHSLKYMVLLCQYLKQNTALRVHIQVSFVFKILEWLSFVM